MGRETIWGPSDGQYLRRDGQNEMTGPLNLSGSPTGVNQAASKGYVDFLLGALSTLTPAEVAALIAVLTTAGGTIDARIAAAVAAYLPLDGSDPMTGPITLPGAPVNNLHAATKQYVDNAIPAATLDTYDAVVAAAGGDYTTLVAACAGEAVGARIFVKSGTYNEAADVDLKDGQQLIGENPDNTIIDFGAANRKIVFTGACVNQSVRNLTIQNSIADYYVRLQGNYASVVNCRLVGSANSNDGVYINGEYGLIQDNIFTLFAKVGTYCASMDDYGKAINNTFISSQRGLSMASRGLTTGNMFRSMTNEQAIFQVYNVVSGNFFYGNQKVVVSGGVISFTGNYFEGADGIEWDANHDSITITGNVFLNSQVNCATTGSTDCVISGNCFMNGAGISIAGDRFGIVGNAFSLTAFITLTADARACTVQGNNLEGSAAGNRFVDLGVANSARDNAGCDSLMVKCFTRMKNTSGGALVAGDVVVIKAVAAGDEFDTTVAAGDDDVWGMLDENTANGAYGPVQREGFTAKLKVNGTVAIGVGDYLSCFNAAGIARKAAAAHMTFAIALEAYAGADSLGVIDALLLHGHSF